MLQYRVMLTSANSPVEALTEWTEKREEAEARIKKYNSRPRRLRAGGALRAVLQEQRGPRRA